jgi:uncharacterized protein YecE (DUF72 family)
MRLRLGMCGFTIARGTYYKQFDVVEVQQTFYDPPPPLTLARWRGESSRTVYSGLFVRTRVGRR